MAFKPNYNQQRADRNRAKAAKKQEKLQKRIDESAKRKTREDAPLASDAAADSKE